MLYFLSGFLLTLGIGLYVQSKREERLALIRGEEAKPEKKVERKPNKTELLLKQAGLKWKPVVVYALYLLSAIAGYVAVWFYLQSTLWACLGAAAGPFFVRSWLKGRVLKRRETMSDQLVQALRLLANAVRGGSSLPQALEAILPQVEEPLRGELDQILFDFRTGKSITEAFRLAADRIPVPEFDMVALAVEIGTASGANLPESFDSASLLIEKRRDLKEKVAAQTQGIRSQGKAVAVVVLLMFLLVRFVFHEQYEAFIQTPLGKGLLLGAMASVLLTLRWMDKKVKEVEF